MRIVVDIMNTRVLFDKEEEAIKKRFLRDMHQKLGVKVDGFFFSPAYKSGHWDGIQDFYDFKTNTFPTGLLPQVQEILGAMQNDAVFQFEIIDDRPDPFLTVEDLDSEITLIGDDGGDIQLRDYQYDSVKSIIENYSGIINIATNGGKTEIASGIIQQILPHLESGERIAFFTHSSSIFNQSIDRIEKRLGIKVGRLGNGKKDIRQVTFVMIPTLTAFLKDPEVGLKLTHKERVIKKLAKEVVPRFTMQKNHRKLLNIYIENNRPKNKVEEDIKARLEDLLYSCGTDSEVLMGLKGFNAEYEKIIEKKNKKLYDKNKQAREFLSSVSVMIADEAHHTSSETWYNSLMSCDNAMYRVALTGSIDKENKMLWQRMQGVFGQITARTSNETLITLGHSAKPTIKIFPIKAPTDIENVDNYATAYEKGIVENDYRNLLIAKLAKMWYDKDKGVLIIVNRIEHGNRLSELLESLEVSHYFIHGDLDIDLREQQLQNMRDGKLKVMISTSIVDEGVDISGIDALILGAGGKSLRQTLQRVGRALRKKKQGENTCQVFDFKDMTHRFLLSHSDQRRQIYVDENFEIQDI
ncbi:DNA helicase [Listeria phage A511]|uniref:Gp111 n=1 Tax=Listeria phage A511 TaxID=2908169 RepID=A8ASU5_BPA51|nr:DNA helicase [Listeria phage A511]AAY52892.1 gp111 [Listeria phage A511]